MEFTRKQFNQQDEKVILDCFILSKERFIEKYMQKCIQVSRMQLSESYDSIFKKYKNEYKNLKILFLDKNQYSILNVLFSTTFLEPETMIGKCIWRDILRSEAKLSEAFFEKIINNLIELKVLESVSKEMLALTKFGFDCFEKTKNKSVTTIVTGKIPTPENYLDVTKIKKTGRGAYDDLETKYKFGMLVNLCIEDGRIVEALVFKSTIRKAIGVSKKLDLMLHEQVELRYDNKLYYKSAKVLDRYN